MVIITTLARVRWILLVVLLIRVRWTLLWRIVAGRRTSILEGIHFFLLCD